LTVADVAAADVAAADVAAVFPPNEITAFKGNCISQSENGNLNHLNA